MVIERNKNLSLINIFPSETTISTLIMSMDGFKRVTLKEFFIYHDFRDGRGYISDLFVDYILS